ncbi:ParB/RepB/Spo0J family partition protein [Streptomyces chiangmaiensis]|uniref:ParB/RepB/Spo0J family partition protein n=1 Tax=Streptomyces chiangmaiensis TaxID=766497 RepID=UPI0031EF7987
MLGTITVTDVLAMWTPDDDGTGDCYTVADTLDYKRQNPDYADLVEEIRKDGITVPIFIRTLDGRPWLADGHHRVAAAIDLGIDMLIWTDIPLDVEPHRFNPMMQRQWGPYRPAA